MFTKYTAPSEIKVPLFPIIRMSDKQWLVYDESKMALLARASPALARQEWHSVSVKRSEVASSQRSIRTKQSSWVAVNIVHRPQIICLLTT